MCGTFHTSPVLVPEPRPTTTPLRSEPGPGPRRRPIHRHPPVDEEYPSTGRDTARPPVLHRSCPVPTSRPPGPTSEGLTSRGSLPSSFRFSRGVTSPDFPGPGPDDLLPGSSPSPESAVLPSPRVPSRGSPGPSLFPPVPGSLNGQSQGTPLFALGRSATRTGHQEVPKESRAPPDTPHSALFAVTLIIRTVST